MNKSKIRIFIRPLRQSHIFDTFPYHWLEEEIYTKLLTKNYNIIIFYE